MLNFHSGRLIQYISRQCLDKFARQAFKVTTPPNPLSNHYIFYRFLSLLLFHSFFCLSPSSFCPSYPTLRPIPPHWNVHSLTRTHTHTHAHSHIKFFILEMTAEIRMQSKPHLSASVLPEFWKVGRVRKRIRPSKAMRQNMKQLLFIVFLHAACSKRSLSKRTNVSISASYVYHVEQRLLFIKGFFHHFECLIVINSLFTHSTRLIHSENIEHAHAYVCTVLADFLYAPVGGCAASSIFTELLD